MPIKSEYKPKMGTMVDGKFLEISTIPTLDIGGTINDTDQLFFEHESEKELVGSLKIKNNRNYRRFMRSVNMMFPIPIDKSNNYRRRHGLPMRRKVR